MPISRPTDPRSDGLETEPAPVPGVLKSYPALVEYLTCSAYEDKAPRKTSTLLVFWDQGVIKTCLNDRDLQRCLWAEGAALEACLHSLEDDLTEGTGSWKRYSSTGQSRKK